MSYFMTSHMPPAISAIVTNAAKTCFPMIPSHKNGDHASIGVSRPNLAETRG